MSKIPQDQLAKLNEDVKVRGYVDREHLMTFLSLIPTNNGEDIVKEVKAWLTFLHESPDYKEISFPGDDIDAVLGDLDSYGRVQAETILKFKEQHAKEAG